MIWTLREYNSSDPLILSVAEKDEISIGEVAESIAKAMDFKGKVVYDTSKSDGQFKKPASNNKLMKLNPEFKFTSMHDGLKETVEWFDKHYESEVRR